MGYSDRDEPTAFSLVVDEMLDERQMRRDRAAYPDDRDPEDEARELRRERARRRPWLGQDRMSQTEVSLRFALYLADHGLVPAAEVVRVSLTGHELTRTSGPCFDVRAFLEERGWIAPDDDGDDCCDWRREYRRADRVNSEFQGPAGAGGPGIALHNRHGEGDVTARLADGRRLIAEVSGGPLVETRSPAEHRLLRGTIGRAVTTECAEPTDVICAVVPRSARTRGLVARWGAAPRLALAGIRLVTVDRTGDVTGFE
jgi:hypothetical protein